RLWSAYEILKTLPEPKQTTDDNKDLNEQIERLCRECDDFMNDDFNTAKVLANLFELTPIINSLKSSQIKQNEINEATFSLLKKTWKDYLEDILGLKEETGMQHDKLAGVMELILNIRKDVRSKKDYATSDKIRTALEQAGITVKDEKDGNTSWSVN
ncbi:MAG: DALR domain-containing protein, partial [Chitinophagaceae bacterium]